MSVTKKAMLRTNLGYEKGQGNRRRFIATKIALIIKEQRKINGDEIKTLKFSVQRLRKLTTNKLAKEFGLRSLEVINAILQDEDLSKNFMLSKSNDGISMLNFYSQEMINAFIEVEFIVARNRLKLVA